MNTSLLLNKLIETRDELLIARKMLEMETLKAPDGDLVVKHCKNNVQFYRRQKPGQRKYLYIHRDEKDLIKELAQKKYNIRYKQALENELQLIEKAIADFKEAVFSPADILKSMPAEVQQMINTGFTADSEALNRWEKDRSDETNPKESPVTFLTAKGEQVKSKSEVMIADRLNFFGVPYDYERPLDDGLIGKYKYFPDFTCLNRRTGKTYYWEHCGRMDDPKYVEKFIFRLENYAGLDIYPGSELLITMETTRVPLSMRYVESLIRKFLL